MIYHLSTHFLPKTVESLIFTAFRRILINASASGLDVSFRYLYHGQLLTVLVAAASQNVKDLPESNVLHYLCDIFEARISDIFFHFVADLIDAEAFVAVGVVGFASESSCRVRGGSRPDHGGLYIMARHDELGWRGRSCSVGLYVGWQEKIYDLDSERERRYKKKERNLEIGTRKVLVLCCTRAEGVLGS